MVLTKKTFIVFLIIIGMIVTGLLFTNTPAGAASFIIYLLIILPHAVEKYNINKQNERIIIW